MKTLDSIITEFIDEFDISVWYKSNYKPWYKLSDIVEALNVTDVGTTLENAKSNSCFVDEIDTIYIDRMLLCSYMQISDTKYSQEVNEWLENKFRK